MTCDAQRSVAGPDPFIAFSADVVCARTVPGGAVMLVVMRLCLLLLLAVASRA